MHVAHRGRAPVAPRSGMEFFEGVKILATYAAAFGEQGGKIAGPSAEGRGLFQQHGVPVERLPVSLAERHGIALGASTFAKIVVSLQNLLAAVGEGGYRLGVAPAEGGAPDIPCDAVQRGVVRRRPGFRRFSLSFSN